MLGTIFLEEWLESWVRVRTRIHVQHQTRANLSNQQLQILHYLGTFRCVCVFDSAVIPREFRYLFVVNLEWRRVEKSKH